MLYMEMIAGSLFVHTVVPNIEVKQRGHKVRSNTENQTIIQ